MPETQPSISDGFMGSVKLLLSLVLAFFALVVLFGGEWDWQRPLAALFFLALALLVWTMQFPLRVRSVLFGVLLLAAGSCFLYGAVLAWNGGIALPEDCSRSRRLLGCSLWNALHAAGGRTAVGSFLAAIGAAGLGLGARFVAGRARLKETGGAG